MQVPTSSRAGKLILGIILLCFTAIFAWQSWLYFNPRAELPQIKISLEGYIDSFDSNTNKITFRTSPEDIVEAQVDDNAKIRIFEDGGVNDRDGAIKDLAVGQSVNVDILDNDFVDSMDVYIATVNNVYQIKSFSNNVIVLVDSEQKELSKNIAMGTKITTLDSNKVFREGSTEDFKAGNFVSIAEENGGEILHIKVYFKEVFSIEEQDND